MYLTKEQEAILRGEEGWVKKKCLEILVGLGEIYGADRLIPVSSTQISGVSYKTLGEGASANVDQQFLLDFLEEKVARHAATAAAHDVQIDFESDENLTAFFDAGIVSIVLDTAIYNAVKEQVKQILLTTE
ncbi:MAG: aconitase X, partial [Nitrososphaerales archaeon]